LLMSKAAEVANKPGINWFLISRNLLTNLKSYVASASLIWIALAFYRNNPYYRQLLSANTQKTFLYLAIVYSLVGLIYYTGISVKRIQVSRGLIIMRALARLAKESANYLGNLTKTANYPIPKPTTEERIALLFALVKLFFLPLMFNFLFANYSSLISSWNNIHGDSRLFTASGFNTFIYPFVFSILLLVDTGFFCFGYTLESKLLGNKVKSVDPTFLGWFVALICYPPFNSVMGNYVGWYANDYAYFSSEKITMVVRIMLLLLFTVYASASVALGPKASNLTNRGIISWGPYRFIRHPAYISKNLFWWITALPAMSIYAALNMAVWSFVYFMRSITEERHLARDPDYRKYCQKVKHRFIPGVI